MRPSSCQLAALPRPLPRAFLPSQPLGTPAFAQGAESADRMIVMREDGHSFRITRAELVVGAGDVSVTDDVPRAHPPAGARHLGSSGICDHQIGDESDPPVDVWVDAQPNEVTFNTSAAILNLSLEDQVLSLELRSRDRVLIDGWDIDAGERVARIELQSGERIYGFGDKRAALDQRGQRIEMLNYDAYASDSNKSYKSIPFYMSSAGYGLFFHNYDHSVFDIGSGSSKLMVKSSGGLMDFYVFVGNFKDVLAQYTDLTGRPAMLPRWAFGYHQGKASYDDDEAFTVAREMRRRKLPFDTIYYDDWVDEAITKRFVTSLWNRHHVRLTMGFGMPMFGSFEGVDDFSLPEAARRPRSSYGRPTKKACHWPR